jgi:DNA polymerase-3 subunit alpha
MGIEILPPDVNRSDVEFSVIVEQPVSAPPKKGARSAAPAAPAEPVRRLSFGLGAVRGVGEAAMQAIVNERNQNGPYTSLFDLCERVDPKVLTKGVLEILIKAGCLDSLGANRAQLMAVVDRAVAGAAARHRDKQRGQKSLFDFGGAATETTSKEADSAAMPQVEDWTHSQKLAFEKEVLGFYLTSHPLAEFAEEIESYAQDTVQQLRDLPDGQEVLIAGMIGAIKKAQTKNPSRNGHSKYVNFDLEDPTGIIRCIMWPDDYACHGEKVVPEAIVIIRGRIDARGREPNIIVNKLFTLEDAAKEFTRQIALKFISGYHNEDDLRRVRDVLNRFPGKTPVLMVIETADPESAPPASVTLSPKQSGAAGPSAIAEDDLDDEDSTQDSVPARRLRAVLTTSFQVSARPELKRELQEILGEGGFRFMGQRKSSA